MEVKKTLSDLDNKLREQKNTVIETKLMIEHCQLLIDFIMKNALHPHLWTSIHQFKTSQHVKLVEEERKYDEVLEERDKFMRINKNE